MDEKSRKGLYYHCDEKWNPTHVYKKPKVYLLQGEESVAEDSVMKEDSEEVSALGKKQ